MLTSDDDREVFRSPNFARRIISKEEDAIQKAQEVLTGYFENIVRKKIAGKGRIYGTLIEEAARDTVLEVILSPEKYWSGVACGAYPSNKGYLSQTCRNALTDEKEKHDRDVASKAGSLYRESNDSDDGAEREYRDARELRHEDDHSEFRDNPDKLGGCIVETIRKSAEYIQKTAKKKIKRPYLAIALLNARAVVAEYSLKVNADAPHQPQSAFEDAETLVPWSREESLLPITERGKTLDAAWQEFILHVLNGAKMDGFLTHKVMDVSRDNFYQINLQWRKALLNCCKERSACWKSIRCIFDIKKDAAQGKDAHAQPDQSRL